MKIVVVLVLMLHDDDAMFLEALRYLASDLQLQGQLLPRSIHQSTLKLFLTLLMQRAELEILEV